MVQARPTPSCEARPSVDRLWASPPCCPCCSTVECRATCSHAARKLQIMDWETHICIKESKKGKRYPFFFSTFCCTFVVPGSFHLHFCFPICWFLHCRLMLKSWFIRHFDFITAGSVRNVDLKHLQMPLEQEDVTEYPGGLRSTDGWVKTLETQCKLTSVFRVPHSSFHPFLYACWGFLVGSFA